MKTKIKDWWLWVFLKSSLFLLFLLFFGFFGVWAYVGNNIKNERFKNEVKYFVPTVDTTIVVDTINKEK